MMRKIDRTGPLIRLFVLNGAMGLGLGLALAGLLVALDVHGMASLMEKSIGAWTGFALLGLPFAFTFAALAIGTAIMLLPAKEEVSVPPGALKALPARAHAPSRRR